MPASPSPAASLERRTSAQLGRASMRRICVLLVGLGSVFVLILGRLAPGEFDREPQHPEGDDGDEQLIQTARRAVKEQDHSLKGYRLLSDET